MKKSIFFAILGMVLLCSLGCTNSKNAPDAFSSADLIGYWYRTYANSSNAACVEMWNFEADKTGAFADTNESNPIEFSFTWSISGDMLTISNSGGTIEMQIVRLTSNELTLIVDNQRYNYIRYNPEEDDITNSYFKVNNIAQFLSQTDKDEIICITGTVTVTYQNGLYLYVKDNSGSLLVYGSINKEYKNGDQIKGICGRYYSYYGLPEMKVEESTFGGIYKGNAPVSPEVVSSLSMNDLSKYVKFENAQFTADVNFNSLQKTSGTFAMESQARQLVLTMYKVPLLAVSILIRHKTDLLLKQGEVHTLNVDGLYWTSSLYEVNNNSAWGLITRKTTGNAGVLMGAENRHYSRGIRAVCP